MDKCKFVIKVVLAELTALRSTDRHDRCLLVGLLIDFGLASMSKWLKMGARQFVVLMSQIEVKYCVDADRICAMGLSSGATRTWAMVASDPRRFAVAPVVFGRGDLHTAKSFAGRSTSVFDGTKNPAVPIYESQRMVDALRVVCGEPGVAVCPNATHDSWTPG